MSRLLRWQYSVPRIVAVVVGLLAVQFVLGLATRSRIERSLETVLGAKAELAAARVSFVDGRVTLGGLCVANPGGRGCRLFDAECCDMDFDLDALIRHGVYSGHGHVSGLKFFVPSEVVTTTNFPTFQAVPNSIFGRNESLVVSSSLKGFDECLNQDWTDQLPSLRLTSQLVEGWSRKRQDINQRLTELKKRSANLESLAEAAQRNPLRNRTFFDTLPADIQSLRAQADALKSETSHAPEALDKGRRIIVAARPQDEQFLQEHLATPEINASQLSTYLYSKHVNTALPEIIAWLNWSRKAFPVATNKPHDKATPRVLLRTLSLAGEVNLVGRSYNVTGELTNFTPQPALLRGPMRLRLSSTENAELDVQLTVDRSGQTPRDELLVTCRDHTTPQYSLGDADGLEMQLSPSAAAWTFSLRLEGDRMTGEMQLVQTGVEIGSRLATTGNSSLQARFLNETLSGIGSVATRLSVSGTLQEPRCALWSNLGPATSSALRISAQRLAVHRSEELLATAQKRVDERLAQLDREIADGQSNLFAELNASQNAWQRLAADSNPPSRPQIERLGRLPAQSLFR